MIRIKEVNPNDYKGVRITFNYVSDGHYQVYSSEDNLTYAFAYTDHPKKINKTFTDELVPDYVEEPLVFIAYDDDTEVGYLTLGIEKWNNRLRIWNILVKEDYRHKGVGTLLIKKAKEMMKATSARQIVLETQSCNNKAISFYLKNGFRLIGFDLGSYSNFDIVKKEVRLEFGYDTIEEEVKELESNIINEIKERPFMEETDLLKFIYQGEFGPGHIIENEYDAALYLLKETEEIEEGTTSDDSLIEELNRTSIKVNLIPYLESGKNIKYLAKMLRDSSLLIKGSPYFYHIKVRTLLRMIEEYPLNFDFNKLNELYNLHKENDFKPFSHSERYRNTYNPHYRVVKKSLYYMYNLPLSDIEQLILPDKIKSISLVENDVPLIAEYKVILTDGTDKTMYISDISNYFKLKEISDKIFVIYDKDLVLCLG